MKNKILNIVEEAGNLLKNFFERREAIISRAKDGVDFVTEADIAVEKFLIEKISEIDPGCEFLAEETAPSDYQAFRDKERLWIIDPLDGTTNFSRGSRNFAISVALVNRGKTKLAIISIPLANKVYTAFSDESHAFLNGKEIKVSEVNDFKKTIIAADWPWELKRRPEVVRCLERLSPLVRQIKIMGSAVADISSLAEGTIDAYLHAGLKPWDVAAASLLVKKAGGKITNLKGGPWDVFTPDILISNNLLHDKLVETICN